MTVDEQKSLLSLVLMAAFADGGKSEVERAHVRGVVESLGTTDVPMAALLQDVLLKKVDLAQCAARLGSPELRALAFELAVGVIDADGLRNDAESRFLASLGAALRLSDPQMAEPAAIADALATLPLDDAPAVPVATAPAVPPLPAMPPITAATAVGAGAVVATAAAAANAAAAPGPVVAATPAVSEAEIDKSILNYAILNGALELLPQSMASMAVIPLQMKMVYRIGKRYGYELDRGHIKDLLATLGVGLTGQYLEDVGRKLIGGLLGKAAGKMVGGLARGATGVAFSFATTYALGHVAKRYYAGGRTMNTQMLKDAFQAMLGQAKGLQQQYQPQIEQQARTVDMGKIVQMVRGA
jgi:uncharacterized protein (DUF697 family)